MKLSLSVHKTQNAKKLIYYSMLLHQCQKSITPTPGMYQIKTSVGQKLQLDITLQFSKSNIWESVPLILNNA